MTDYLSLPTNAERVDSGAAVTADHEPVAAEGFTVLHEPRQGRIEVDIVLVHGLGGHPHKTWTTETPDPSWQASASSASKKKKKPHAAKRKRRRFFLCSRAHESDGSDNENEEEQVATDKRASKNKRKDRELYWPRDLLPTDVKSARILAYGYDSRVTKGYAQASKNNVFTHAKDLLYALQREKPARRMLIFVAHSLGGILVKEVLRRSEASEESEFKDIVQSTQGVIFLGTPHRGSPGLASLGDLVRRIASFTLRVDSNDTLLRALGTDSPELDLGRESFVMLWRKYNFRVKTFQEAFGISGVRVGPLGDKVVPDTSSTLDDPREHAETISANHMDMCRFSSPKDPGYKKVSGEIQSILASIVQHDSTPSAAGVGFLKSIAFPEMDSRRNNIADALDHTCDWLFSSQHYYNWIEREDIAQHHGLLWVKGKPGSGKSTLMKEAFNRVVLANETTTTTTAAFFFNARSTEQLEKTPYGLFRSILHQVLQQDLRALSRIGAIDAKKKQFQKNFVWHQNELQQFLIQVYATSESRPSFIFIDALDECSIDEVRDLVDFFRKLTTTAYLAGARLNVCLSSRHYPQISIKNCPEVVMEHNNEHDILHYITTAADQEEAIASLKDLIFTRSSGVFLWVVLVVSMLKQSCHGRSKKWLERKLLKVPGQLDTLFRALFLTAEAEDMQRSRLLIQLVLFAKGTMTQSMLHCALSFGQDGMHDSVKSWTESDHFLATPDEQHKMIIELSRGLLEVIPAEESLPSPPYQFIHESVRDFFLKEDGFSLLGLNEGNIAGSGHSSIVRVCVNFLSLSDFRKIAFTRDPSHLPEVTFFKTPTYYDLETARLYPLLTYTAHYLFHHIEAAEEFEVSQANALTTLSQYNNGLLRVLKLICWSTFATTYESTLLVAAAEAGFIALTKRLVQMGFDVNEASQTPYKFPLIAAIGSFPRGATVLYKGHVPKWEDKLHVSRLLLENGASVHVSNDFGQTPLHVAAVRTNSSFVRTLLSYHAPVNSKDKEGDTPLHQARHSIGHSEIYEVLVAAGANTSIRNLAGKTPEIPC